MTPLKIITVETTTKPQPYVENMTQYFNHRVQRDVAKCIITQQRKYHQYTFI